MSRILVLNLGATSTKAAIFEDENQQMEITIRNTEEEMEGAPTSREQVFLRKKQILDWMDKEKIDICKIDAVALRGGGMTKAKRSGTYLVNENMRKDAYQLYNPDNVFVHGARIAIPLLDEMFPKQNVPIYVTDPPYVDELCDEAKLTGHPFFPRGNAFQALNHKAVGRMAAAELGKAYDECNFVIIHLGGGVSVAAHEKGRIIEVNKCTDGDGPFSPERTGSLPVGEVIKACFSGKYTEAEMQQMVRGQGGVMAYLGTSDMRVVEKMIDDGDEIADLVLRAFVFQVVKAAGGCCAVLAGNVDMIAITGGIAYSQRITNMLEEKLHCFAPIRIYPGEAEAEALVAGALRVMRGQEEVVEY